MELETIVAQIEQLMADLEARKPIPTQAQHQFQQKISLDWTYHSNAIEGNRLTFGDTRAFLLRGVTAAGKPFRDYIDIKGHDEAVKLLFSLIEQQDATPLNESFIRELHKIALVEPYRSPSQTMDGTPTTKLIQPGQYKTQPNHVRTSTGAIHYYASPEETPAKMGDLVAWYRLQADRGELHPLLLAAAFHYRFVAIHPFDDGNGRLARLLMNFILMRHDFPPIVIPLGKKEQYLRSLEQADTGDLELFTILIGEELLNSLNLLIRAAKGENIEEADDLDKKLTLLQRKLAAKSDMQTDTTEDLFVTTLRPFLVDLFKQLQKFLPFFPSIGFQASYKAGDPTITFFSGSYPEKIDEQVIDVLGRALQTNKDISGFELSVKWSNYHWRGNSELAFNLKTVFTSSGAIIEYAILPSLVKDEELPSTGKILIHNGKSNGFTENQHRETISAITNRIYREVELRS